MISPHIFVLPAYVNEGTILWYTSTFCHSRASASKLIPPGNGIPAYDILVQKDHSASDWVLLFWYRTGSYISNFVNPVPHLSDAGRSGISTFKKTLLDVRAFKHPN